MSLFSIESKGHWQGFVGVRATIDGQEIFVPDLGKDIPTAIFLNPQQRVVMELRAPSKYELHIWGLLGFYPDIAVKAVYRDKKFLRANIFRRVAGMRGNEFLGFRIEEESPTARPVYMMKEAIVPTSQQTVASFMTRDNITFHMMDKQTMDIVLGVSYAGGPWKITDDTSGHAVTVDFDVIAPHAARASMELADRPRYVGQISTLVESGLVLYKDIYNTK